MTNFDTIELKNMTTSFASHYNVFNLGRHFPFDISSIRYDPFYYVQIFVINAKKLYFFLTEHR